MRSISDGFLFQSNTGIFKTDANGVFDNGFGMRSGNISDIIELSSGGFLAAMSNPTEYDGHVVGEKTNTNAKVFKIKANGSYDKIFSADTTFYAFGLNNIIEDKDGMVLASGYIHGINGQAADLNLIRLNEDGSVDETFNASEMSNHFYYGIDQILSVGDKIYVAGAQLKEGIEYIDLMRLNSDGSIDSNFSIKTLKPGTFDSSNEIRMAVNGNQELMIIGDFVEVDGQAKFGTVKFSNDGSITSFDPKLGYAPDIKSAKLLPMEKFLFLARFMKSMAKKYQTLLVLMLTGV